MARERRMIEFGEFVAEQDAQMFGTNAVTIAQNVVPASRGYKSMKRFTLKSTTGQSTTVIRGAVQGLYGSTAEIFCGDTAGLYRIQSGDTNFTDVSVAGGYSVDAGDYWEFSQYGNTILAASTAKAAGSGGDAIQTWTLGVSANFAALSNAPGAKHIGVVRDWVVAGHTYDTTNLEQPYRVWWAGMNQPTQWPLDAATKAAVQSDWQDLQTGAGPIRRVIGGDVGTIFQDRAITRMHYESPQVQFRFETITRSTGTLAPQSVVEHDGIIYWWAQDGFRAMDASGRMERIGANRVDTAFLTAIGSASQATVIGGVDKLLGVIVWSITNSVEGLYMYHPASGRWSTHLISIYGSVKPYFFVAARKALTHDVLCMFADDKNLYQLATDGTASPARIQTAEQQLAPNHCTVMSVRVVQTAGAIASNSVTPISRSSFDDAVTLGSTLTQNTSNEDEYLGRVDGRYHAFRYQNTGDTSQYLGVEVEFETRGRR